MPLTTNYYQLKKIYEQKSLPESIWTASHHKVIIKFPTQGAPRYTCHAGSFTLEAAVILPVLACFFVSILFFFRIMQVQLEVQQALDDTGRQLAVYLAGEKIEGEVAAGESAAEIKPFSGSLAGYAAAGILFQKELKDSKNVPQYVRGGTAGITLFDSEFSTDQIHLKASYSMRLPVRIFWVWEVKIVQRADCRKWTGWREQDADGEEDLVYITETGTVYHTTKSCTHLTLSIRSVMAGEISGLRNENGEKYRECKICADKNKHSGPMYITDQGDCYHYDLGCSGLKRTIYAVHLSEVKDRRACQKCAAEKQGE